MLKNAGLDQNVANWSAGSGTPTFSTSDAEQCPYSGSLGATVAAADIKTFGQCATATFSGTFNFGGRVRLLYGRALCQVNFYSGFNCDRDLIVQQETDSSTITNAWESLKQSITVTGANSVLFQCYVFADDNNAATVNLDMMFVSRDPALY
jgi:hypothetical protein